jgi:hypothetical protein
MSLRSFTTRRSESETPSARIWNTRDLYVARARRRSACAGDLALGRAQVARGDEGPVAGLGDEPLDLELDAALDELVEVVGVEVLAPHAQEEAVEDRLEALVGGHLVRRAEHAQERHVDHGAAVVELPLVEEREQRVEDGAVRLEDLVEEDDLGLGHHALGAAAVGALAEGGDVDRPEELVGLGEAREQVLEVVAVDVAREGADEGALRGAGRADERDVLARDDGDEEAGG